MPMPTRRGKTDQDSGFAGIGRSSFLSKRQSAFFFWFAGFRTEKMAAIFSESP